MSLYKKCLVFTSLIFISFIIFLSIIIMFSLPNIQAFRSCFTTSMNQVYFCKQKSSYLDLENVPQHFIDSLLISEDASFYFHNGFDFHEIKNSFFTNIKNGTSIRGASTISQQLVKNAFLYPKKTYFRKIIEALSTYRLEKSYSKNEILEYYLNVVDFGHGSLGLKKASENYFSKSPSELTLTESLFLVQALPNPKRRTKGFFAKNLEKDVFERMEYILEKLKTYKKINEPLYLSTLLEMQNPSWFGGQSIEIYGDSLYENKGPQTKEESLELEMYKSY